MLVQQRLPDFPVLLQAVVLSARDNNVCITQIEAVPHIRGQLVNVRDVVWEQIRVLSFQVLVLNVELLLEGELFHPSLNCHTDSDHVVNGVSVCAEPLRSCAFAQLVEKYVVTIAVLTHLSHGVLTSTSSTLA